MKLLKSKRLMLLVAILVACAALWPFRARVAAYAASALRQVRGEQARTVSDRLTEFGAAARERWKPFFAQARVAYPPQRVVMVGLKDINLLEVYAAGINGKPRLIRRIKILAASGDMGPKLREGDQQVPEGIYPVESLNPNSRFHVSLRVGYSNAFDRQHAQSDGRHNLGGDIMIHGGAASIGCLAVGDEAAEDLFVLAAESGIEKLTVLLCPVDLRTKKLPVPNDTVPAWYGELIEQLRTELAKLPYEQEP